MILNDSLFTKLLTHKPYVSCCTLQDYKNFYDTSIGRTINPRKKLEMMQYVLTCESAVTSYSSEKKQRHKYNCSCQLRCKNASLLFAPKVTFKLGESKGKKIFNENSLLVAEQTANWKKLSDKNNKENRTQLVQDVCCNLDCVCVSRIWTYYY